MPCGRELEATGPGASLPADLHAARLAWRVAAARQWLCKDRIDAKVAREEGVRICYTEWQKLRRLAQTLGSHAREVMAGGMRTGATRRAPTA
eukprot:3308277-Alexandrium_andersonii.AAC.1